MRKTILVLITLAGMLATLTAVADWVPTANTPPFRASDLFLLTDGRVLVNEAEPSGFATVRWWTLTPDINGSYRNGTWAQVGSSTWTHLYYGSGVFADGRVIICGGEYSSAGNFTNKTEIFNPITNSWSVIAPPTGWSQVGDAPGAILQDGRFFIGMLRNGGIPGPRNQRAGAV